MAKILLVEDDAAVSMATTSLLRGMGHDVLAQPSAELGLKAARRGGFEVVLLDLNLPGKSGLDVLPDLLALEQAPAVAIVTANPTAQNAMDALALGASAHLSKPVEPADLRALLEQLLAERASAAPAAEEAPAPPAALVGHSKAMLELGRRVGALARSDATVLVLGESGTGKELVARAIHERSARARGAFVAVSCAALPEALLEAELFGHAKGAFTGAHQDRPGRVERADGGTLFLDEVAELTPAAQAKLLRFLEERSYERVGEDRPRTASVRVLAATNASLEERVAAGDFREDLYYRLDVTRVELPPLRTRLEDLPLLVEHFLARLGRPEVTASADALAGLLGRSWPGNVRELRNAVEAALVALGSGRELRPEHFAPARGAERAPLRLDGLEDVLGRLVEAAPEESALFDDVKAAVERTLVAKALERTNQNQVAAARLLGMNRATFRRKMADHGLGTPQGD
ncbi:MAG: sigma-54-dependent transcriptional regulator [Planctomycetota bacterium]